MERNLSELFTPDLLDRMNFIERTGPLGEDPRIRGLAYDSRDVKPGYLFFALPGLHTDGHSYIAEAVRRGAEVMVGEKPASAIMGEALGGATYLRVKDSRFAMSPVADAFYRSPSRKLQVIGVTGTEGKSTVVYLLYQLLLLAGKKTGFLSTVQFSNGEDLLWNPEHQTTPEAITTHRLLAEMAALGTEAAVLESSSHGLSPRTNRLGDVAFDCGVMTNVNHEHLEFHGTWEQYRDDKANLFRALGRIPKNPPGTPFGVVNGDDPSAEFFIKAANTPVFTFSARGNKGDLSILSLEEDIEGNAYRVLARETGEIFEFRDKLPGAFNPANVLAAVLTASKLLNLPIRDFLPLILNLKPVKGRMTPINRGQPFETLADFAHTPASFSALLPSLKKRLEARSGRLICLFGSAGDRDRAKRAEQGRIAARWSDMVILTDEDPRGEEPMDILEEIARGVREENPDIREGKELFLIPHRPEAIRKAFSLAKPGDLTLLLGKGHENSIIYRDFTAPYDEIAEAEQALGEMGFNIPQKNG